MKGFFLIASKAGPLAGQAIERFRRVVEESVAYAGHVAALHEARDAGGTLCLLSLGNEPGVDPWMEHRRRVVALEGDCRDRRALARLKPSDRLALEISDLPGRFSALVMDVRRGVVAAANSAVRVDPIFVAESREHHLVGTQASVVCRLLHDRVTYDTDALYTYINTGFFGTDATSYPGVTVLPPLSTWTFDGRRATVTTRHLADVKRRPPRPRRLVASCQEAYLDAIRPLAEGPQPVDLGVSGGKDSRLVLVALRHLGIQVSAYTLDRGADNAADVYLAGCLARLTGVPHVVRPVEHVERRGGADVMRVDLLHRTAETLRATDGAVYGHDRVRFLPTFAAPMALNGLGGETMRGGYAEGYRRLDDGEVWRIATNQFSRFHALFRPEARERYEAELRRWLEPYQGLPPADILDCLYIHFRCGRWIGGTSRSATMSGPKLYPFLDNRLALQITRAPAAAKLKHRLIRSLIRRFSPAAADLPLALEHWGDAPAAERERARQEHPTAFESPTDRPSLDWRDHLPPPLLDHIRRYCVTEGRLDLLASLLDVDAARTFLLGDAPLARTNKKVLFGLYSACVMTSEPWLTGRLPSAPITITLAAAA